MKWKKKMKTDYPDLESPRHNFWKHLLNWVWNQPRWIAEELYEKYFLTTKKELQSAVFERLIQHLRERKDVQNLDLMNLAGFCRNCLSKWYREEAQKKGIEISDPDARKHVYGMPYDEWKQKYRK